MVINSAALLAFDESPETQIRESFPSRKNNSDWKGSNGRVKSLKVFPWTIVISREIPTELILNPI